ncbi:MAG: HAD family hydrolase, partial [Candidatus Aureabacteria bacterium]|nr:HAD family hydrolase [Candidatus Auribacterota bacterium]
MLGLNKAIFLDRDGTIIEDSGYIRHPDEIIFIPGAMEALKALQEQFLLFVVTNQSGVSRGILSLDEVNRVNEHLRAELAREKIFIREIYVCPHQRSEGCVCIKPNTYFIDLSRMKYALDVPASYVIGDHPHDMDFASNVNATGLYVLTGHGLKHSSALRKDTLVFKDILDASLWILKDRKDSIQH